MIDGNGPGTVVLAVDGHDLAKKFCAAQIISYNSIFTPCVRLTKICSKVTSYAKKVIPCVIKVTHGKKYTQPTETVAPALHLQPFVPLVPFLEDLHFKES